jgi:hypothetical protein
LIPVGALLGGALGTVLGLRPTIVIGAAGASVAVLPLFFSPLRAVRTTGDAEELVRGYNERFAVRE